MERQLTLWNPSRTKIKSTGYTNISSKVIKHCAIEISKPPTYIFYNIQRKEPNLNVLNIR